MLFSNLDEELGLVNHLFVLKRLLTFSGNLLQASLPSPIRFIAQLLGIEQGPPPEEPALEVRLKRKDDGAYDIVDVRALSVLHGVKPTFDDGGVVSARVGDRTFTQTFSPVDVSIAEDFQDDGTIHLVDYKETPREEVTVLVGLGDTRLTDDGKAILPDGSVVPIEVAVAPCNDVDENRENDCPLPMLRGEPLPPPSVEEVLGVQLLEQPTALPAPPSPPPPTSPPSMIQLPTEEPPAQPLPKFHSAATIPPPMMELPTAIPVPPSPPPPMMEPSTAIPALPSPPPLTPPSPESPTVPPPSPPPPPSRAPFWLFIGLIALSGLGGITYGWRRGKSLWGNGNEG